MNLRQPRAVRANSPCAINFVPGAFVAEHQKRRVCGRELYVVVPIRAAQESLHFASLYVDGDELKRPALCKTILHHLAFARIAVSAWRGGRGVRSLISLSSLTSRTGGEFAFLDCLSSLLINDACEQRLVCVDSRDGCARRQFDDLARRFRVEVCRIDCGGEFTVVSNELCVIDLTGLSSDDHDIDATFYDLLYFARLQINCPKSCGCCDD